jgi:fibronectin type 3 domain-containing protein
MSTTTVNNVAPVNSVAPVIAGQPAQGQTVSVSTGTWSPTPTSFAYQWQRSTDSGATWTNIGTATTSSYSVAGSDLGAEIRTSVSANNSYGTTTVATAPVTIASGAPAATTGPTVSGHANQGQILSATSTWNPAGASYSYQWQSSSDGGTTWTDIGGATASTYTLAGSDLGHLARVSVSAVNPYGTVTASSSGVGPILNNAPINSTAPALTGPPQRTGVLATTAGAWTGLGDVITYQWQRSPDGTTWTGIAGATSSTYAAQFADEGDFVRALVTATNASGVTTASTAPTQIIAPFPPANSAPPVITGVPERGVTLNASLGTWTGPDNVYSYQWQRDAGEGYVNISGATSASYTLVTDDESATVRVLVTATDPDGTITQASAPTAPVTDAFPVNTVLPQITGTIQRGFTVTAAVGTWAGIGNSYAYQWQRSADGIAWTNISAATTSTYVVDKADEGDRLRVMVTVTNPDGTASTPTAPTIVVPTSPPVATTAPAFVGTALRGAVLTAGPGIWSAVGNAYTYQWQRSPDGATWTNITGATGLTYTVQTADESDFLRFTVTATNPDGTTIASTSPTSAVAATPPASTSVPTIVGPAARSANVSATVGAWSGIGNTYTIQWERSSDGTTWTNIPGATAFNYTITVADEASAIRALIAAVNPDGTASRASAATQTISSAPPVAVNSPVITGAPLRGDTLNSTQGTWTGIGNAYSDQWQRSADGGTTWTNITGATDASYTLTTGDVGDLVRLLITAVNPDATVSAPSNLTATVSATPPVNTAAPGISGAAQRGLILNSAVGTWNGISDQFSFQWQRSADGTTWTNINGATGASYQLAPADEGDVVRILVTGTNPDGTSSAASTSSATVAATPPVNTVPQVITGSAQRGQTLQSSPGTWLGIGNSYAYRWQHSSDGGATWTDIGGATTPTYPLGTTDENTQLRVVITTTNLDGTSTVASAPTATVPSAAPVSTAAPTVTGTSRRGFILTAAPGTWSGIGNVLAYQWQRSTDNGNSWSSIAGATSTTYTLGVGDEGAIVRVLVTASNADGTVSAASNPTGAVGTSPPSNNSLPTIRGIAQRGNTLSSTTGAWAGTGNTFTLQWQRSADSGATWTNITGATGTIYAIQAADEGDVLRLALTAANPDGSASAASPASATVIASPPVNTAPPVVTGTPQRTATLSTTSGGWGGAGVTVSYQWQRSSDSGTTWTDIAGATKAAYTIAAADEGDVVRTLVTATNADGSVAAGSAATPVIQADPPVNVAAPVVQGTPSLGATLSTDDGSWTPVGDSLSYSYAWQRGDAVNGYTNIPGATGATYTTVGADAGESIRVVVTATNVDGSLSATSAPSQTVQPPPVNSTAPAAPAGTYMNGFILTADNGTWDRPATYSYNWLRCPGNATGVTAACTLASTKAAYALTVPDIGARIAVTVTATSIGGSSSATSALTPVITGQPLTQVTPPSISGNPQPPNTLYANPGSWSVALTGVDYDWDRCDADGVSHCALVAADTAHYSLTSVDDGHTIVLIANVSSPGRVATGQSAPLVVQDQPLPQATVLPTVSGTTVRTNVMGATGGVWTNSPRTLAYQWERCDTSGHNCQAIPGATRPTYQLTNVDEGSTITIAVSATNTSGTTTATAISSGVVTALPPVATGRPALSTLGVQQSVAVSVTNGTWQATGLSTYTTAWQRCNSSGASCAPINGATGGSYTPTAADVGHTLVVVVTATNVDGSVPSASAASDVVLPAAPRWRDLPVLSANNGYVGGVLSITDGVFTGPAVTSDVTQIMRCTNACTAISSAPSYTIATADIGAILRVRETASNAGGTAVIWSAQYVGPVASSASASAVLGSGQAVLRNKDGDALATARLTASASASAGAVTADALVAHATRAARGAASTTRVITVRRTHKVRGALRAWVCAAAIVRGSAPTACTRQVTIRGASAKLRLPATITGRVRVVVVRRGR